jgi:FKBP-type peptidyl-prolyl cis-trans isomerase SlyD
VKIENNVHVSMTYTLTNDAGETLDQAGEDRPFGFVFGAGQVIPGLEKQIAGMEKGQSANITIAPSDAYGERNEEMVREIPRIQFPADIELKPGMPFEAQSPQGPMQFRIKEVTDETVYADFNHPLAGETLHFALNIIDLREATPSELSSCATSCSCDSAGGSSCGTSCGGGCGC